jgi:hypothetical protein
MPPTGFVNIDVLPQRGYRCNPLGKPKVKKIRGTTQGVRTPGMIEPSPRENDTDGRPLTARY